MKESNSGFIVLYRKMTEWEWYTDNNVKATFLHCLLMANHTEKQWRGINVERGSFITSYERLSIELGLSVQQVRTAIKKLENTGELTNKPTNKYSVISIINYNNYQNKDSKQQTNNNQITNKQQSNNNQITITNNDNNENHNNNDNNKEDYGAVVTTVEKLDYASIITYLNSVVGSQYKHTTRKTQDLIKARFKEGFTYDDFRTVIDKKANEWLSDKNMSKYLRPETLFGTKFESYVNQKNKPKTLKDINLDHIEMDLGF